MSKEKKKKTKKQAAKPAKKSRELSADELDGVSGGLAVTGSQSLTTTKSPSITVKANIKAGVGSIMKE